MSEPIFQEQAELEKQLSPFERLHELEGSGSLRKCLHCGRWFHNEADAGEELEECPARV